MRSNKHIRTLVETNKVAGHLIRKKAIEDSFSSHQNEITAQLAAKPIFVRESETERLRTREGSLRLVSRPPTRVEGERRKRRQQCYCGSEEITNEHLAKWLVVFSVSRSHYRGLNQCHTIHVRFGTWNTYKNVIRYLGW